MAIPTKYINPFTDFGFKRIFGEESNKDILLDFLNEILAPQGIIIKELNYKKNDHYPTSSEDRKVIFDLYCENDLGDKFTIELQKSKQEHFKDRMLYYSTFSIQEQGITGNWNYKLKAVYVIAILDFVFEKTLKDKVMSYVQLLDLETKEPFMENLNFITIEMPKFSKEEHELETNLDKWLYLLKHLHELENIPTKLQGKILEKVFQIAEYTALSKEARREYEESLKNYNDLHNTLETTARDNYDKGYQEGIEILKPQLEEAKAREEEAKAREEEAKAREEEAKAREEEAKNALKTSILNMQKIGLTTEQIAEITNLTVNEIESVLKKG